MLDLSHIPKNTKADIQTFTTTNGGPVTGVFTTWTKPRGCTFVRLFGLGAGGGGGGGATPGAIKLGRAQ